LDDDCDGSVDGNSRSCGSAVGVCARGTQSCTEGDWGECSGGVTAGTELCDAASLDEDCDGSKNEGCDCYAGQTEDCTSGDQSGTRVCDLEAEWGRCQVVTPAEECNGLDDDGNGLIDDGADCNGCDVYQQGGTAYLLCTSAPADWADAASACEDLEYHLVVINSQSEQDDIEDLLPALGSEHWWIGLRDEDDDHRFENNEWVAGTSAYRNWDETPDDDSSECVALDRDDGRWEDKSCGNSRSYICESP